LVDGGAGANSEQLAGVRLDGDGQVVRFSKGTLSVSGTNSGDEIHVTRKGGVTSVTVNAAGPFLFSTTKVKRLSIDAGAGDDRLIGKRDKDNVISIER